MGTGQIQPRNVENTSLGTGYFRGGKSLFSGVGFGFGTWKIRGAKCLWHVSCSKPKPHPRKQAFPTPKMPCSQAWVLNIFSCALHTNEIISNRVILNFLCNQLQSDIESKKLFVCISFISNMSLSQIRNFISVARNTLCYSFFTL